MRSFLFAVVVGGAMAACGLSVTGSLDADGSGASSTSTSGTASSSSSGSSPSSISSGAPIDDAGHPVVVDAEPPCPQPVLQFDGVNDHADVPDDTELDLPNTFTVEAWIRPTVTTAPMGEMHIVSHHDSNALKGWALLLKDGRLELRTYGDGTSPQIAGNDSAVHVVANRWSFVAGTYDGNTLRVYADGTLRDTEATSYARYPYRGPLVIGRAAYDLTRFFFAGQIDEVRLSRVARYTGNTAPIPTAKLAVDSNTIALWHFDDAIGTNGTFVNAVGPKHAGQLATAPARPQAACGDR